VNKILFPFVGYFMLLTLLSCHLSCLIPHKLCRWMWQAVSKCKAWVEVVKEITYKVW